MDIIAGSDAINLRRQETEAYLIRRNRRNESTIYLLGDFFLTCNKDYELLCLLVYELCDKLDNDSFNKSFTDNLF